MCWSVTADAVEVMLTAVRDRLKGTGDSFLRGAGERVAFRPGAGAATGRCPARAGGDELDRRRGSLTIDPRLPLEQSR